MQDVGTSYSAGVRKLAVPDSGGLFFSALLRGLRIKSRYKLLRRLRLVSVRGETVSMSSGGSVRDDGPRR